MIKLTDERLAIPLFYQPCPFHDKMNNSLQVFLRTMRYAKVAALANVLNGALHCVCEINEVITKAYMPGQCLGFGWLI
jgi:hypothetical protein